RVARSRAKALAAGHSEQIRLPPERGVGVLPHLDLGEQSAQRFPGLHRARNRVCAAGGFRADGRFQTAVGFAPVAGSGKREAGSGKREGRREKGEGRREKGEGRREKGEGGAPRDLRVTPPASLFQLPASRSPL